jgi:type VI secretion system protein ImpJ
MTQLSRVVWSEGMHLAQHHFQQQGRYFEDSLQFALAQLFYKAYGVTRCELDANALRNGVVSLLHARGVMPDGLPFQIPDGDPAPPPRRIDEIFSPTQDSHLILLAIPAFRPSASNCAPLPGPDDRDGNGRDVTDGRGNGHAPRFVAEQRVVSDETTGRDEKPVSVGRKNLQLAVEAELGPGTVALPLARVRRDGAGHFVYDPDYVPTCLQIGGSEALMERLRRLVDLLDAKSDAMAAARRAEGRGVSNVAAQEAAGFWLLHAIHSAVAPLRQQLRARSAHPEQLYVELARLAGALCTFALDSHPRDLPAYDHDQPEECFAALDRHIRRHLEVIIPTSYATVPLARVEPYMYAGVVADKRCFGRARWYLGISSPIGEAEVLRRVPTFVKVCSREGAAKVVARGLPGLTLTHAPAPPPTISPRADHLYFSIAAAGPCWQHMLMTSDVGVYVPDALPNPDLELRIAVES